MRQKYSTKSFDTSILPPPPYPWTFSLPETLWNTEGFTYEIFWHCGTKNFRRKILILSSPLIHKLFRYRKFSETQQRRVPLRDFLVLRDKKISTEDRDITPLSIKFFDTRNLWNTKGFLYEILRHCETKSFWKKLWYSLTPPPVIHTIFRYQNFSKTQKGAHTKFFGTVRHKNFDWRSWYAPSYP